MTDKEIVQIALDNFDTYWAKDSNSKYGLCNYAHQLLLTKMLGFDESRRLKFLICKHAKGNNFFNRLFFPAATSTLQDKIVLYSDRNGTPGYFWPVEEFKPRERYLKYLLKKVS